MPLTPTRKLKRGTTVGNSLALVTDSSGRAATGATTAAEIGYVAGVTSAVQTQVDAKLPLSGGMMTGQLNFSGTTHAGIKLISLTTTQRDALTAADGMMIYNSTTARCEQYFASSWVAIGTSNAISLYSENPSSPTAPSASGLNSVAIGSNAYARRESEIAFACGGSSSTPRYGGKLILRASTTDATQTEMICGASSGYLLLSRGSSVLGVSGTIIALQRSGGGLVSPTTCFDWKFSLLASAKSSDGSDAQMVGDLVIDPRSGGITNYTIDIDVFSNSSNTRVRFLVTGAVAEDVEWVCHAELTEINV